MLSLAGSIAFSGDLLEWTALLQAALATKLGMLMWPLSGTFWVAVVPSLKSPRHLRGAGLALCSSKYSFQPPPPVYMLRGSGNGHHLPYSDCKGLL